MRLIALFIVLTASIGLTSGSAEHNGPEFPHEVCFDVPSIEHCVEDAMAYHYLVDPTNSTGQSMWIGEAVFLWGLPLTEARFERNADGHCVRTQWFERAVFELHKVSAKNFYDFKLRRLGAELHGDTTYEPQFCTFQEFLDEPSEPLDVSPLRKCTVSHPIRKIQTLKNRCRFQIPAIDEMSPDVLRQVSCDQALPSRS
ncbi:hypothetical protein BH23CHL2_BH23CHL2_00930 [soil metagenome]